MGTDKRSRQKENRRSRLDEMAKNSRRRKIKGRAIRIGIIGAIVVLTVGYFSWKGNNDEVATPVVEITTPITDSTIQASGGFVYGAGECSPTDGPQLRTFVDAPQLCIDLTKKYSAIVVTNFGEYKIELDAVRAPGTVNNFVNLARAKYFDGTVCHRAIPSFVVQCGDPTATGSGGPGYSFADELPNAGEYKLGSLAMANSGPNTNGSQFFVISGEQGMTLPPSYSLFGQVTDGLETTVKAMNNAGNDDPISNGVPPKQEIKIVSLTIIES